MASLRHDFKELLERIRDGREWGHASFEPIYYMIFSPSEILEVKRQLPAWKAALRNAGWEVNIFSIAEHIESILQNSLLRKIWIAADRKKPLEWDKTNRSLANALEKGALADRLKKQLKKLEGRSNAILLVTDIEALHPYMRISAIESSLQGKFSIRTVFLYPGERTGKTKLKFLKFYPEDGNYRSVHVGG